jgi:cyclophilin family peptidyl-prolyl cis-trans isomerase
MGMVASVLSDQSGRKCSYLTKQYDAAPEMQLQPGVRYEADIDTTAGSLTIELLSEQAPNTVNNFVALAKDGYFDGIVFHRVIQEFMIQTGDPTGTGMGGPGYRFADELPPALPYEPGVVAMANAGPNTNGSQFFICTGEQSKHLNNHPNYTVFGRVSSGMDTVQKLAATPVSMSPSGERSKPSQEIQMNSVKVVEHEA